MTVQVQVRVADQSRTSSAGKLHSSTLRRASWVLLLLILCVAVTNLILATYEYSTTTANGPSKERRAAFLRQSGHASRHNGVDNQQPRQPITHRSDLYFPTEPPLGIERRIQQIKRQLFKSAKEHHKAIQVDGKRNRTASYRYQPMNHSVVPSSSNVTFFSSILPPPNLTNNSSAVIILVISAQSNFDKRQAIRETWAYGHDNVYFVVGHSNCHHEEGASASKVDVVDDSDECQEKDHAFLLQEQLQFRDLIEIPIVEQYRQIPEKVVQAYHWSITHLPQTQWLVKVDDDSFVRVSTIEQYLIKYNSRVPLLFGLIKPRSLVRRTGKNADVEYPHLHYPYWPQGSCGHIVSRATAQYITSNSPHLHRYQGEDVSIGIWLDQAKDHNQLLPDLQYIHIPKLVSPGKVKACHADAGTFFIVGHDLTPIDFQRCTDWNDELPPLRVWEDAPADLPPPIKDLGSHPASSGTLLDLTKGASGGGGRVAAGITDSLVVKDEYAETVGMPHGGTGSVLIDIPPLQN
jgi:hypothetical protein